MVTKFKQEALLEGDNGRLALYNKINEVIDALGVATAHAKGYFADAAALAAAIPTGVSGDYAIVGDTDTVYVWDADTSAWKNTNQPTNTTAWGDITGTLGDQEDLDNELNAVDAEIAALKGAFMIEFPGADTTGGGNPAPANVAVAAMEKGVALAAGDKILAIYSARLTADKSNVDFPSLIPTNDLDGVMRELIDDGGTIKVQFGASTGADLSANTYRALVLPALPGN